MYQDRQSRVKKLREQLPKIINMQTEGEEVLLRCLEELKDLSSAEDVAKDLQKYVFTEVIYNRIPWFYEFIAKQNGNELCAFLAGDISRFPKDISQLKAELEQERKRRVTPKWIVISTVAIASVFTLVGTATTVIAQRQTSTYEAEKTQLNATLEKNQQQMEILKGRVKQLEGEIAASRKNVEEARRVVAQYKSLEQEYETLDQKNQYLNGQLYRMRTSPKCRLLGMCQ